MKHAPAFTRIEALVVAVVLILLGALSLPAYRHIQSLGRETMAVSSCKQITLALKRYAQDHNGSYPDQMLYQASSSLHRNSNNVFRELFKAGLVTEEQIFGCPGGPVPDGRLGNAPEFELAVAPGENYWAMTAGVGTSAPGSVPLVYENPVSAGWPPQWGEPRKVGSGHERGTILAPGKVVIGNNDGSVYFLKLVQENLWVPEHDADGVDIFTRSTSGLPKSVLVPVFPPGITDMVCQ